MNYTTPSYDPANEPNAPQAPAPNAENMMPQFPPESDYTAPEPAYAAPEPAYAAPEPAYTAPQTVYNAPPVAPVKKKKKPLTAGKVLLVALCFALLGSVLGGGMVCFWAQRNPDFFSESSGATLKSPQAVEPTITPETQPHTAQVTPITNTGVLMTPAQVYAANVPGIVGISNEFTSYNYFGYASSNASSGTGFIISADGEILTNYHVIEGAQTLTVTLYDGKEYPATVLGYEASSDVALIKIDAENLSPLTLGDSDTLIVGDEIAAIGNPLGELTYTMTVGYVSAKERDVNTDGSPISMMQIDAAINPGNSGGPLFNLYGEVVGITTAKYSGATNGGATIEGIGFAIPINDVKLIIEELRENGTVTNRAFMGITGAAVSANDAEAYSVPLGFRISSVTPDSGADKAGLQKNDIIIGLGDYTISSYEDLYKALRSFRAGDTVTVKVYRGGETLELAITFDVAQTQDEEQPEVPAETTEASQNGSIWDFLP